MHPDPDVFGSGELRHQLEIQQEVQQTPNAPGELAGTWRTLATVRALVEGGGGVEQEYAGGTMSLSLFRVKLRYFAALDVTMRLVWVDTGVVLQVKNITPGVRRMGMILACAQRGT